MATSYFMFSSWWMSPFPDYRSVKISSTGGQFILLTQVRCLVEGLTCALVNFIWKKKQTKYRNMKTEQLLVSNRIWHSLTHSTLSTKTTFKQEGVCGARAWVLHIGLDGISVWYRHWKRELVAVQTPTPSPVQCTQHARNWHGSAHMIPAFDVYRRQAHFPPPEHSLRKKTPSRWTNKNCPPEMVSTRWEIQKNADEGSSVNDRTKSYYSCVAILVLSE